MAKGLQAAEGINGGKTGADDEDGIALADFVERISGKDIFDTARCRSAQPVEHGRPRGGWMPGRQDQNVGHDDCAVSPAYPPLLILSLDDPNDIADVSHRATVEMGRKLRLHELSEIAAPSKDASGVTACGSTVSVPLVCSQLRKAVGEPGIARILCAATFRRTSMFLTS